MSKKTILLFITCTLFLSQLFAQTPIAPSSGDGSVGNPYQIASLENLYWISQSSTRFIAHYVQVADIDASASKTWFINDDGSYCGFPPIGNDTYRFMGSYNGAGYKIIGLYINNPLVNGQGLFGITKNASISGIQIREAKITGQRYTGGVIGWAKTTSVKKCSFNGEVHAQLNAGGICGIISENSAIENCYSLGNISTSENYCGGIVGMNESCSIKNCYTKANVKGYGDVGGFVGLAYGDTIQHCYSTGHVTYSSIMDYGGFVGTSYDIPIIACFYDKESAGLAVSSGGIKKTTAEMKMDTTYISYDWDFSDIWTIHDLKNDGYPYLKWQVFDNVFILNIFNLKNTTFDVRYFADNTADLFGICWNETGNPSLSDHYSSEFSQDSLGAFITKAIDLTPNTQYFIRAFIKRGEIIEYSEVYEVHTLMFSESGTADDPYQISTLEQLQWISTHNSTWNKHMIQLNDINASSTESWNNGNAWSPIGNWDDRFRGSYDGQGYCIDSLYVKNSSEDEQGLFGCTRGAKISNLELSNIFVSGDDYVGGLVGRNYENNTISNCQINGYISGDRFVGMLAGMSGSGSSINNCTTAGEITNSNSRSGGLIGYNTGYIAFSNSSVQINAMSDAGGLTGSNSGTIRNCFSTSDIRGSGGDTGGFVGINWGTIINCYSRGDVSGYDYLGGFMGQCYDGKIMNCYSTGSVNSTAPNTGGFLGSRIDGSFNNCFYDMESSNKITSIRGTGKTSEQMKSELTFTNEGWSFTHIWGINDSINDAYPYLRDKFETPEAIMPLNGNGSLSEPYEIESLENLYWISTHDDQWNKHYIQTNNIDAKNIAAFSTGWLPIGANRNRFTGSYDGAGHIIADLYICRENSTFIGLFGFTENAVIRNIGLENVHFTGLARAGGLVGEASCSEIVNTYTTGYVNASDYTGGLIGWADSTYIHDCYTRVHCDGVSNYSGGLIGYLENHSIIRNSYSTGQVVNSWNAGGLIGYNNNSNIFNCFWDKQSSGFNSSDGGYGRLTQEMKSESTFLDSGWNFIDTWVIDDLMNDGYPTLKWEIYGVGIIKNPVIENYQLKQNYPNPFNPTTTLIYALPIQSDISLSIYDISGKNISTWTIQDQQAGFHEIIWNGKDKNGNTVPSGVYIYCLKSGDFFDSKKMVFVK